MNAEDTVIDLTDMGNYSLKIAMTSILKQQAEITWGKAIKEVVEWIKGVNKSGDFYYSFDQAELEARLKEWGVE